MKKRIVIILLFIGLLTSLKIMDTYGLFETEGNASSTFEVGKWEILLNGEDVTLDRDITLNDFIYETDSHTEAGYLAPGGNAYLDLDFDATNTKVSLSYEISIDTSSIEDFPNLTVKIIDKKTNEEIDPTLYSGQILIGDTDKTKELRIKLDWENDTLYDDNDINVLDSNISFLMHMHFSQIIEE